MKYFCWIYHCRQLLLHISAYSILILVRFSYLYASISISGHSYPMLDVSSRLPALLSMYRFALTHSV